MAAKSKSGSNIITGTTGADHLNGGSGGDVINGMGGNDRINAGAGDDVVDGGAGNDIVNGDAGNDTGIYILGENVGSTDVYDGGSGIDTLQLVMTRAEWQSPAVQADIARYLAFLAQVTNPVNGQATNANFTFSFGLTVSKFEALQITVDGVAFDPRDEAVTLVNDVMTAGEDAASISVDVLANDSVPDLIATLTNTQPAHGSVTLTRTSGAPATPDTASFVYTPDATHWQYLAAGETATDTFTYTVTDSDGDTRTATVTVTITGSNDAPTLGAVVVAGATTEDGATSASGDIAFADIDSSDVHTVTSAADGDHYVGTFTATVTDDSTGDGTGSVTWNFDVDNAAIQYLAAGEVLTQTYTVTVSDGQGGTVDQSVTITITGTNDAPTIIAADTAGGVSETNPVTAPGASSTPVLAEVESNDSFATAQVIDRSLMRIAPNANLGDQTDPSISVTGAVSAPGAQDVYRIDLAAGELITLDIDFAAFFGTGVFPGYPAGFGLDSFVFIYDSAGNLLNFNDDASRLIGGGGSQANQDSYLQFATPTAGTFFIVVKNWDGDGAQSAGPYTLQVSVDSQNLQLTDSGAITFADVDLTDAHSVSVTAQGTGYLGALTAVMSDDTTGGGSGEVAWTFSVANAAVQFLAAGETRTQTYSVVVSDGSGGSVSQDVTITITGENDGPVISTAFSLGQLTEGQGDSVSGVISFDDVDLIDGHTVVADAVDPGYRGTFTAVITDSATGAGGGQVTWTFAATDAELANLSEGQSLLQRYVVTVDDGNGGTTQQLVNITIVGTNDAPIVTAAVASGTVQEDGVVAAAGTIDFAGIDLRDTHTVSSAQQAGGYLGVFTAVVTDNGFNDGTGSVSWNFQVDNAAMQHLGVGETLTQNYTVTVSDGRGGTVDQTVSVTITGSNDGPVAVGNSAATNEDTAIVLTAASLLANDTDADGDALTISEVSGLSANGATVSINAAGDVVYDPASSSSLQGLTRGQQAVDTFTYTVIDAQGATSTATVSITVAGQLEAPVANPDTVVVSQNGSASGNVVANDTVTGSTDNSGNVLVNGSFEDGHLVGPGGLDYPASLPGWTSVQGSFEVWGTGFQGNIASDGIAFLELDNGGGRDAYSSNLTTDAGREYTLAFDLAQRSGTSASTNQVEFLVNGVSLGIFTPPTTTFTTFTVTFVGSGSDVITFQEPASANNGVGGLIDNLRISADADVFVTAVEGSAGLVGAEVDGSNGGEFTVQSDGSYTFDTAGDFGHLGVGESATTSITYTVTDDGGSDSTTLTVTVQGENDGPVANNDAVAAVEDQAITFDVRSNDTDLDGDTLSVTHINGQAISAGGTVALQDGGLLRLNPNGALTYTPAANASGEVAFTYTVADGFGGVATASATIDVAAVADAPVLAVGSSTVLNPTEGSAMKTTMTLAAGDVVTFNWDFVAHDYMPFNDFAFASVNGAAFMLGSVQVVGDYGTTGWKTFTFTAPAAGSYSFGVGVSNVNDSSLDSHLLVDNLRVNGTSVYSFEGGLGGWATLGSVGVELIHDGVSPTDGARMASLNSASASAASIESFLGLAAGRLKKIAEAVGQQGDEVTVPVSMTLGAGEALEDSYVVITGFPAGSVFNFGEADASGGWRVPAADLGGNLRISTPDDYSGSFTLTVVATTFIAESGSSASTAPQTITVTIDPAPGAAAPQAASLALSSKDADAQILPSLDEEVGPQTVPADPDASGSKYVGPQTLPGPETAFGSKEGGAQVLPGLQDDDAFLPMPAAGAGRDWAGLSARLDVDLARELPVFAVDDFLPMTLTDAEPQILPAESSLDLDALFEASPADLALADALSALTPEPLKPDTLDVEHSWHQLPAHDAFQ